MSNKAQRQLWTSGLHGGARPRSGRPPRDTVRVACSIPRQLYEELCARERETGIYRTQILTSLVSEALVDGLVDRELRAPPPLSPSPSPNGTHLP